MPQICNHMHTRRHLSLVTLGLGRLHLIAHCLGLGIRGGGPLLTLRQNRLRPRARRERRHRYISNVRTAHHPPLKMRIYRQNLLLVAQIAVTLPHLDRTRILISSITTPIKARSRRAQMQARTTILTMRRLTALRRRTMEM